MGDRPTMRDVADLAGVSPMTVSRALKDDPAVRPSTRSAVRSAADRLGYRRNDLARNFRDGSSGFVGLAITNIANPFYAQLAQGVDRLLSSHGLRLIVGNTEEDHEREVALVDGFASARVDGMLIVPSSPEDGHLDASRLPGVAIVLIASPDSRSAHQCVLVDDAGGAAAASALLLEEGHRDVGFLGFTGHEWTAAERWRGFSESFGAAGVDVDGLPRATVGRDAEAADLAMDELMASAPRPTAVFTANNRATLAACRWSMRSSQPLRIVGFDDVPSVELFAMPVSLVTYSAVDLGHEAAAMLIGVSSGVSGVDRSNPHRRVMSTSLRHYGGN